MNLVPRLPAFALFASALLLPIEAVAHHPMGGEPLTTFGQGLLSGLGHPVIGLDHLAAIVAVGLAAAFVPAGFAVIAAFIAATIAGTMLHVALVTIPGAEIVVALSVLSVGAERSILTAYVIGFAAIQFVIADASRRIARGLMGGWEAPALRAAGGAIFGIGVAFVGSLVLP